MAQGANAGAIALPNQGFPARFLDQAGDGWTRFALVTDDYCPIDRCQGMAVTLKESADGDAMPASYAVMFSSERAATAAEGDVAIDDFVEERFAWVFLELEIGDVKADGEFVVGDGVAEFFDPDGTRPRSSNPSSGGGSGRESESARAPAATRDRAAEQRSPTPEFYDFQAGPRDVWLNRCAVSYSAGASPANPTGLGEAMFPEEYCECIFDYATDQLDAERLPFADLMNRSGFPPAQYKNAFNDARTHCSHHYGG